MMTITTRQMDSLAMQMRINFEKNTIFFLQKKYPGFALGKTDEQLVAFIREGIDNAESYNINRRRDVSKYIEYMITLGSHFEQEHSYAWAKKILSIRNLAGEEKIRRLMKKKPIQIQT
ncbi:MAG: hypothetical protein M3N30_08960 [Bacteroidota bacterium]|nr:hypothetical protein [Bacteroidota bacterium]